MAYLEAIAAGREPYAPKDHSIYREAAKFEVKYISTHPEKVTDKRLISLFEDLNRGASWGILAILDGPADGDLENTTTQTFTKKDYDDKRKKARAWTAENFSNLELHSLFNLAVEFALNPPTTEGAPGYLRGHTFLLRHIVDKEGSIFAERITPEMKKVLVNGAFWEETGARSKPSFLADILQKHSSDLDPTLAENGIRLYHRNKKEYASSRELDLTYFSDAEADAYKGFVSNLNFKKDQLGIDSKIVDELTLPYISLVVDRDQDDHHSLRFGPKYNLEKDTYTIPGNDFRKRLQDPLVQQSLLRSEYNRTHISIFLGFVLRDNLGGYYGEQAIDVFEAIGGKTGDQMLRYTMKNQISPYERGYVRELISKSKSSYKNKALSYLGSRTRDEIEAEERFYRSGTNSSV